MSGRRAINKFIGIDYSLGSKTYLYFRLWEAFLRWAMQMGADEVQSGQTSYRAKLDLGHDFVPLSNFFRYRNPLMHAIAALVAKRISWGTLDEFETERVDQHSAARRNRRVGRARGPGGLRAASGR